MASSSHQWLTHLQPRMRRSRPLFTIAMQPRTSESRRLTLREKSSKKDREFLSIMYPTHSLGFPVQNGLQITISQLLYEC